MNTFNRTNAQKTPTTTWVTQTKQYTQNPPTQRVYNAPVQYQRGRSTGHQPINRRVRSVHTNRPNQTVVTKTVQYNPLYKPQPIPQNQISLDHMNNNLQKYNQQNSQIEKRSYQANPQRPVSIRSGQQQQQRRQNPVQKRTYRQPSTHSRKEYKSPIQRNILQETISRKTPENFVSNPTDMKYGEKSITTGNQTLGLTISERNQNTEIYTSNIKTSQLLEGIKMQKRSGFGNQELQVSNFPEQDMKYQSINPGSNYFNNTQNSAYARDSKARGRSRQSKSSRNDSSGRVTGNTFINIPKVQTNYKIMNKKKKKSQNYKNTERQRGRQQPDPYFQNKIQNSNEMLSGYNSAEKGIKLKNLNEYERAVQQIDSNKLFKNDYQIDNKNKLNLEDNIFEKSNNFMNSVKSRERSRNASRSRSRLANMELLGRSTDKNKFNRGRPQAKADPFSYRYNVSSRKEPGKQNEGNMGNLNQMMTRAKKYGDTAITFDPIIEKKVRALPKEKVKKALFNNNNIKSTEELKNKILKKNEILMKLKAQHLKLLQDPKNPDNLKSQLEMREKQNKKILEKIKKIKEQTEEKKEEYKELIEIDNQMKSLLGMMSESEKRERDRLIAELKRTDALYLKTKRENEELKAQMEDSSKGMVFKQHLIDEEVNRVKSMIEDQLEDDFEKGNKMLINQIQKMYNKLLAAKN